MATRSTDEYAGTEPIADGETGDVGSGPIDPAEFAAGNGGGSGSGGTGDDGDDDEYATDRDGNPVYNKDGSRRKKRGRKRGGSGGGNRGASNGKRSSKDDLKSSVDALSNILMMTHMGIAGVTNTPEMELEKEEADLLANATVPVLDQFNFVPDPRFIAAFGLITASAKVYGPRFILIRARKIQEREDKRAANAKPVYASQNQPNGPQPFTPDLSATIPPEMKR